MAPAAFGFPNLCVPIGEIPNPNTTASAVAAAEASAAAALLISDPIAVVANFRPRPPRPPARPSTPRPPRPPRVARPRPKRCGLASLLDNGLEPIAAATVVMPEAAMAASLLETCAARASDKSLSMSASSSAFKLAKVFEMAFSISASASLKPAVLLLYAGMELLLTPARALPPLLPPPPPPKGCKCCLPECKRKPLPDEAD